MISFLNLAIRIRKIILISVIALSTLSCGSGSVVSAGISGTGIVFGTVTGFGSIFVNGVEYDIDDASFDVDGVTGTFQVDDNGDLKLGMVVKLEATDNGDGTGVATSVTYEDAMEGPVVTDPATPVSGDTNLKEFTVLGSTIIINATTTTYHDDNDANFGFDSIATDDVIEVSGFADQSGNVFATRIEKTGVLDPEGKANIEIHGQISESPFDSAFIDINGVKITLPSTLDLDGLVLTPGIFVEVEGEFQQDGSVIAEKIESEDDDRDEITNATGEVSLQGVVTDFNDNNDFLVSGIPVNASAIDSAITDVLVDGLEVEVEGNIIDGVLVADELEIRSGDSKFTAIIKSVASNSITIGYTNVDGDITLVFDSQSQLADETDEFDLLALQNLSEGMTVKVEVKMVDTDWVVTSLKLVDSSEELSIEGVVTQKSPPDLTLTINGLVLTMHPDADYEIADIEGVSSVDFFDAITEGTTKVELEDAVGDVLGLFDSAEID